MSKLSDIINNFKDKRVLIVGDVMLDEYFIGKVNRISPEAPIPILDVEKVTYVPGGAANAANNVKSLGAKTLLAGVIGPEECGITLKHLLRDNGIDNSGIIIDEKRRTTLKTRAVAKNQQLVRIDQEDRGLIGQETEDKIFNFVKSQNHSLDIIIISDYAKGVASPGLCRRVIEFAKVNNILCSVDPKGEDYLKYKGATIVTPNEKELGESLGLPISKESQFLEAGKALLSHLMSDYVLVTRSEKGMCLFQREKAPSHMPALNKNAIDTSGAGDTAIGTFALSIASGASPEQAMTIASHACSIVVGKHGTATVTPEELLADIQNSQA